MAIVRLFSPEQALNAPRIAQIEMAKTAVHGCAYALSFSGFVDLIIAQAGRGVRHSWLCDLSQYQSAYNPADKAQIDRLNGVAGVTVLIGHSAKGDLMHDKFAVIDGKRTQYGSANYTGDSERQTNHVILDASRACASDFLAHWQRVYGGMLGRAETIKWGIV